MVPLKFYILNAVGADNDIVCNVGRILAENDEPGLGRVGIFLINYVGDSFFTADAMPQSMVLIPGWPGAAGYEAHSRKRSSSRTESARSENRRTAALRIAGLNFMAVRMIRDHRFIGAKCAGAGRARVAVFVTDIVPQQSRCCPGRPASHTRTRLLPGG